MDLERERVISICKHRRVRQSVDNGLKAFLLYRCPFEWDPFWGFLLSGFWVCHLTYQQVIKWSNYRCKALNESAIETREAKKASTSRTELGTGQFWMASILFESVWIPSSDTT